MADVPLRLSEMPDGTAIALALNDLFYVVDVSDTAGDRNSAAGSSYQAELDQIVALVKANLGTISPTQVLGPAVTVTSTAGAATFDMAAGFVFEHVLDENTTLTITDSAGASGVAFATLLLISQDATGGRTLAWVGVDSWLNGSAPTMPTGADEQISVALWSSNGLVYGFASSALADIATSGSASDLAAGTVPTARLGSGTANSGSFLRGDQTWAKPLEVIAIAIGDETTALTTGTKFTFRMPFAITLSSVRASLTTASSSGAPVFDINEGGTSILSTKLTIDASEKTSSTAATAAVISDSALADDAEITIDVDTAGTGAAGAKIYLIGTRT